MRNINRQKIQAFNILSNKKIVYILLVSGILFFLINPVYAQANHQPKEIPLWSAGNMPGGTGPQGSEVVSPKGSYTNIAQPHLIVHYPEHPNGMAVLVISGGGYAHIEVGSESSPAAEWLASQGITAFELIYRLPAEGWSTVDVPFQDAQRAIRVIRDMAERMGISRNKVGVMGFSAGGHLAAMIETEPERQFYAPIDDIDRHSAKCDFAALVYPVITMLPPYNHTHSEKVILGSHPDRRDQQAYSAQFHVSVHTPPTFLTQAEDDPISNVENSKEMYTALQRNQVVSTLQLYPTGGHGWGLGKPGTPETSWPSLFKKWAQQIGVWQ
jgi:acetyl esterase/lipase